MKEHLGFNVFTVYMTNKVIKVISIVICVVWKDFLLTAVIKRGSLLVIDEDKAFENVF